MNKTLKKFAIAIMVAGATVTATRAPAAVTTNATVLENVGLNLTMYVEGAINGLGTHEALATNETKITSADLIKVLAPLAGYTAAASDKLVLATQFGFVNFLPGAAGVVVSNTNTTAAFTNNPASSNFYIETNLGNGTLVPIALPFYSNGGLSFVYLISNNVVSQILATNGTNYLSTNTSFATLATNLLLTNGPGFPYDTNIATTLFLDGSFTMVSNAALQYGTNSVYTSTNTAANDFYGVGYWTVIAPVGGSNTGNTATNITITEYSPKVATNSGGNGLFTNISDPVFDVYVPGSGTNFTLYPVTNWLQLSTASDYLGNHFTVYKETGSNLTTTPSIVSETAYSSKTLTINTGATSNANVATTNLIFSSSISGISTKTAVRVDLAADGLNVVPAADRTTFLISTNEVINVGGTGYVGGAYTTNSTNSAGIANFGGGYTIGTNSGYYIQGASDAIVSGTVTVTFLKKTSSF